MTRNLSAMFYLKLSVQVGSALKAGNGPKTPRAYGQIYKNLTANAAPPPPMGTRK